MAVKIEQKSKEKPKKRYFESIGGIIQNAGKRLIYETIYHKEKQELEFAIYPLDQGLTGKNVIYNTELTDESGIIHIPPHSAKEVFQKEIMLTASGVEDYESDEALFQEGYNIIKDYWVGSEEVISILSKMLIYYQVWDKFRTTVNLVIRGMTGKGKNRLQDIFRCCGLRAFNVGNVPTSAALFRSADRLKPLLLFDELTFNPTNPAYQDFIALWNSGFQETGAVTRVEKTKGDKFTLKSFRTYSPKIAIVKGRLPEAASQSRCFFVTTETTHGQFWKLWRSRQDKGLSTIDLQEDFFTRTESFKNKCLLWKFRNWDRIKYTEKYVKPGLASPRLFQTLNPLFSVIDDPKSNEEIFQYARQLEDQRMLDTIPELEMNILHLLWKKTRAVVGGRPMVGEIAEEIIAPTKTGAKDYGFKITPQKVASIIRNKFYLSTIRVSGGTIVLCDRKKIEGLALEFGVLKEWEEAEEKEEEKEIQTELPYSE